MIEQTDVRVLNIILEEIDRIIFLTSNHSLDEIRDNYVLSDSLEFEFQKMDYDLKRLSMEFRLNHPEFPFSEVKGIRNRVAHNYESVNFAILFEIGNIDLPKLRITIIKILED